jgi:hypothetical protein
MAESSEQGAVHDGKRVIEFDMFVDDLEPEESANVRGGTGKGQAVPDEEESPTNAA